MPYEILHQGEFMLVRLFGVLTEDDLTAAVVEMARIEDASTTSKDRAIDLSEIEDIRVGFSDVLLLANRRRTRTFTARIKSALIAHRPVHVGYARMFQTLSDHPQIDIRIVGSLDEALQWFGGK